ncbi:MAG: hypothetical protein J6L73_03385 [Muribaculaceae bacterium]|nr:hypothetical protein [Muribaculaceae bacterium]
MTKNLLSACALILVCLLTGCSKEAFVTPASTTPEGPLAKCFEIVDEKYPVQFADDGDCSVTIKIKRTDVSLPFTPETVALISAKDAGDALALAGFGYTLLDANGKKIETETPEKNDDAAEEQLKLLKLKPGETGEITLEFDSDEIPEKVAFSTAVRLLGTGDIELTGGIDRYTVKNFKIGFDFADKEVKGKYQYSTSPAGAYLYLDGEVGKLTESDGNYIFTINMHEDNGQGMITGVFDGELALKRDSDTTPYYYTLTGNFVNYNGKEFVYNLRSAPLGE